MEPSSPLAQRRSLSLVQEPILELDELPGTVEEHRLALGGVRLSSGSEEPVPLKAKYL